MYVKDVAHCDERRQTYHPALQFPSTDLFSILKLIVLVLLSAALMFWSSHQRSFQEQLVAVFNKKAL